MSTVAGRSGAPGGTMVFSTPLRYHDRLTKARYVWEKYRPLLEESTILDVGADRCHLRQHLKDPRRYWGIGRGPGVDQQVDLEQGRLDFPDGCFDCVLCLDVLEHLEMAQVIFDELCRVSSQYVIVSLPNPWAALWGRLRSGRGPGQLKFYGLPAQRPADRHRWFFSASQAAAFLTDRGGQCGFRLLQLDHGWPHDRRWRRRMAWRRVCQWLRLLPQIDLVDLYAGHVWVALQRAPAPAGQVPHTRLAESPGTSS